MRIILASKSGVRKKILDKYKIENEVIISNVDESEIKESLIANGAGPLEISKNLAEIKSTQVSNKHPDQLVLGADSVISLNNELINKPKSREEALKILKKLNNSKHNLISSVCISKNGSMIWNHSDSSELKMKNLEEVELIDYLVIGADSVVSLNNQLINKPKSREEALKILKKLNNSKHYLISSVCISKNGSMVWNHSDISELKMKKLTSTELAKYLAKIETKTLLAYGVYQVEANGLGLFEYIKGDKDSIMGLPIKDIINYINQIK